jgi:hypothetical protein
MKKLAIIVTDFANNHQSSINVIGNYLKKTLKNQGYAIYYENKNTFSNFTQLEKYVNQDTDNNLQGIICFAGSDYIFDKKPEDYESLKNLTKKNIKSLHIVSFVFKNYAKKLKELNIPLSATIYKTEMHSTKFVNVVKQHYG